MVIAPVESFARIGTFSRLYAEAGEKGYSEYLHFFAEAKKYEDVEYNEELVTLQHNRDIAGLQTIVFTAMCFEAAIYDFAAIHLGDKYVRDHIDKLDVLSKWVLVLRFVSGIEIQKDQAPYGALKKLITARNRLVHAKSQEFDFNLQSKQFEKISKWSQEYEKNVHNAFQALVLMSLYLDKTLAGHINPLPSYSEQNAPMRRYYSNLKEVIDECRRKLHRTDPS